MAAQTWNSIQQALLVMLSQAPSPYNVIPADFAVLLPQATSYAEQRIYRELTPVNERNTNSSLTTTAGNRLVSLTGTSQLVLTVERFALLYPATVTNPAQGQLYYYDGATLDVIDLAWPNQTVTLPPNKTDFLGRYWAMLSDSVIAFSPTPDAAYTVVLTGTFESVPISAANQTSYLSIYYPELLISACMVFLTGALLRNFGSQSDDPRQSMSWETQYKTLMQSAVVEEQRRRMAGVGWSQFPPNPLNKPDRS